MSSNVKPKTSNAKEAPTEPFKRAVSVCLRAISGKNDLEVSFAAERPGLAGGKARLPEPPRRLNEREAAIVRGHAELDCVTACLSRSGGASQACAGRPAGPRGV